MTKLIRYILGNFLKILIYLPSQINKILIKFDPNHFENYIEDRFQDIIDKKQGTNFNLPKSYYDLKKYDSKLYNNENPLKFYTPSRISSERVASLFLKEPYTISWFEEKGGKNKPLIDIGANMGIYSLYYAHVFGSEVYSFEPSFRNLDLFSRNINLNKLNKKIHLISNPISETEKLGIFNIGKNRPAAALSGFDNEVKNTSDLSFSTQSITLDNYFKFKKMENILVKIDVDGGEEYILKGAKSFLNQTNKVSLEIETRHSTTNEIKNILESLKFKLINKLFENDEKSYFIEFWEK